MQSRCLVEDLPKNACAIAQVHSRHWFASIMCTGHSQAAASSACPVIKESDTEPNVVKLREHTRAARPGSSKSSPRAGRCLGGAPWAPPPGEGLADESSKGGGR